MKLVPGKWRVLIEGDARVFEMFPGNRRGLDYLLGRLVAGEDVAESALAHYGIRVRPLSDDDEVITVPREAR